MSDLTLRFCREWWAQRIGGDLGMKAGGSLNLTGTQVAIGTSGSGTGWLAADKDVNIATAVNEFNTSQYNDPSSKGYDRQVHQNQTVIGAGVASAGDLTVKAGTGGAGSLNIVASDLKAGDALQVSATDDVNLVSAQERHLSDTAINRTSSSMLRNETTQQTDYVDLSKSVAGSLSGNTIAVNAGNDINVRGSFIAGTGDVDLVAGGAVNIVAGTNTLTEKHHKEVKESGFLSGGGFGISYGERTTTTDQSRDATTQSLDARSIVGSVDGNLNIKAGEAIKVGGSDLYAGHDMTLEGKSVTIDPGRDNVHDKFDQSMKQDGFTLAVGGTVVGALQTLQTVGEAASESKDGRVQALAAATAALAVRNAASDIAQNGLNVSVSLTFGHSESQTSRTSDNLTNVGSTLKAGNDLTIIATGAGADSNINIIGSDLTADGNIKLKADNEVNLVAAQDLESQHTDTSSMSAAAGIGASFGSNGTSIGVTASASVGKGKEDGKGTTQLNSHVTAGKQLAIESGGDTNIKGAVASGEQVVANVGGDLNIESLQDKATFDSKNQSLGVSGTFGMGVSVSGSFSDSKLSSDYASVQEQSGIRAGAGGFQLVVDGNTDLKGAVISSSQEAIDAGKNSLSTGSLTVSDIANHADYKGHSVGLSGGLGTDDDSRDAAPNTSGVAGDSWKWMQTGGNGMNAPIALGASGNDSSTTVSGISGGVVTITNGQQQQALTGKTAEEMLAELNRDVSNEKDTSGRIENNFDKALIQAGFAVAGEFGRQVGTLLEDYAKSIDSLIDKAEKLEEKALTDESLSDAARLKQLSDAAALREEAQAVAADWGPTGTYRQVTTALLAATSGNVAGGVGQFGRDLVINYAQQNGAQLIGELVARGELSEGSPLHAALHGLVACAAAFASDQQCGAGAAGAAASTLLASLFANPAPDEKASDVESRRNLLVSLVAGIATASDVAPSTATSAATAATDNNWLASRQIAQMEKERKEAKTLLEEAAVIAKWSGVSLKQDALTVNGIGKGLVEAGWSDIQAIAGFLLNIRENVAGLQQLLDQEDVLNLIGDAVAKDVKAKLDTIEVVLRDGGDQNSELLGKVLGSVLWQVGGVVTSVGAAKQGINGSVELAKIGIKNFKGKFDDLPDAPLHTAVGNSAVETGAVWDSIKAVGPTHPGTVIPIQFEMVLEGGAKVWVDRNATKHLAEFAGRKAKDFEPDAVRLASQIQISTLVGAVNEVAKNGIKYRQVIKVDGWELMFAPPKSPGQYPALYHALFVGK